MISPGEMNKRLGNALKALLKPGVDLKMKPGVPYYSVHKDRVGVFVRKLDGVESLGVFEDGKFREL